MTIEEEIAALKRIAKFHEEPRVGSPQNPECDRRWYHIYNTPGFHQQMASFEQATREAQVAFDKISKPFYTNGYKAAALKKQALEAGPDFWNKWEADADVSTSVTSVSSWPRVSVFLCPGCMIETQMTFANAGDGPTISIRPHPHCSFSGVFRVRQLSCGFCRTPDLIALELVDRDVIIENHTQVPGETIGTCAGVGHAGRY